VKIIEKPLLWVCLTSVKSKRDLLPYFQIDKRNGLGEGVEATTSAALSGLLFIPI
jgi:hypothetical protein